MKNKFLTAILFLLFLGLASPAQAASITLTFEASSPEGLFGSNPSNYAGLSWSNFQQSTTAHEGSYAIESISNTPDKQSFIIAPTASNQQFYFESLFTRAQAASNTTTIIGLLDGVQQFEIILDLGGGKGSAKEYSQIINPDYNKAIDTLVLSWTDGALYIDNFTFSGLEMKPGYVERPESPATPAPEPSAMLLGLISMLGAAGFRKRLG
jgi:hypothetical protein